MAWNYIRFARKFPRPGLSAEKYPAPSCGMVDKYYFCKEFQYMFEIFTRKQFLVDSLDNFVDVHNHMLPGIDDGARDVEESMALVKGFSEFGVNRFVASPHIMHGLYPNTPETIGAALNQLKDALWENGYKDVALDAGAEHMIDDNFEALLEGGEVMPLRNVYLLVEMSFLQAPLNFDQAIIKVASAGYYPILAHPERYKFLHLRSGKYRKFREQGISLQLNLLSLCDYYDKEVQKMALKLLDEGMVDFVASDVHRVEHLEVLKDTALPGRVIRQLLPVIQHTIQTFY